MHRSTVMQRFSSRAGKKTPTILLPQTLQILSNGTAVNTINLGAPKFNQGLSASILQLP